MDDAELQAQARELTDWFNAEPRQHHLDEENACSRPCSPAASPYGGNTFHSEWGDLPLLNHKVTNIAGLYALDLSCSPMDGPAPVLKRV